MKKIALTLIAVVVFTACYSQRIFQCYKLEEGEYNEASKKYVTTDKQPSGLKLTVQGGVISVNDKDQSVYKLGKQTWDENGSAGWEAIDEQERVCIVGLKIIGDIYVYGMYYDNLCFTFYAKEVTAKHL